MSELRASGLPGDWINGWLAAIGVTVLVPGVCLGWSREAQPVACFDWEGPGDLADMIAEAVDRQRCRSQRGAQLKRLATLAEYRVAAALARSERDASLAVALTDLAISPDRKEPPVASPFYTSGPGTVGTLGDRLQACLNLVPGSASRTAFASLTGHGNRVKANGLGFDIRRIAVGDRSDGFGDMCVDPIVETLAFFGLLLFPARGDGTHIAVRGWRRNAAHHDAFVWPVWSSPLSRWSIDAVLGVAYSEPEVARWSAIPGVHIHSAFETVRYQAKGAADPTRGFGSRRLM